VLSIGASKPGGERIRAKKTAKVACLPVLAVLAAPNFEPTPPWDSVQIRVFLSGYLPRRNAEFVLLICEVCRFMQILVRDNNVDQALRALKKKLQREGVYREMKLRRHYEKPSEKRAREKAAAVRRARKLERKRMERDGAK
jgi:small subunit ribosomal protein S21